ncbi:type II toxin-antitoxin system HipA family toxin [Thermosulfurimonas sp. F29]|uniref:type II toxin-antitoxin system HipA family toxin n=1 Tax=Thermosulfurimonas sp. F29 TaxID=2867247 RepID=UPI001C834A99|nr:type II toxin-antitoxin system HipA family toxin [Thermosulfurimonas sp. F29]MBX6423424.1 type II toxin-antitoxin system HipA family toxin [Thermosulfurimonas sp. F29]
MRLAQRRRLLVWRIDSEGNPVPSGELMLSGERVVFRYLKSYLRRKDAYPLDPIRLPLVEKVFRATALSAPLGVLDDTLPDAWGLAILSKKHRFDFSGRRHLALGLQDTSLIGALFCTAADLKHPPPPTWIPFEALKACFRESTQFEMRKAEAVFRYLQVSGTSAGGARPKVTLVDEDGTPWLVKFPSVLDPSPKTNALVEAAGLRFAKRLGVPVPDFRVIEVADACCLAVKRFDIVRLNPPFHGRCIVLSLATLMGGSHMVEAGYEAVAGSLRRYVSDPDRDLRQFFRQAVVNVMIVNTDDHLKNFACLWDGKILRLSPAYDLVGNLWGLDEHSMPLLGKTGDFSRSDLVRFGRLLGLSSAEAKTVLDDAVDLTESYLREISDIPGTESLCKAVRKRLNQIKGHSRRFPSKRCSRHGGPSHG